MNDLLTKEQRETVERIRSGLLDTMQKWPNNVGEFFHEATSLIQIIDSLHPKQTTESRINDGINYSQWQEWAGEIVTLQRDDTRWVWEQLKRLEILESQRPKQYTDQELHTTISAALMSHKMSYTGDDNDGFLPLVDMLTPPGDKDISRGKDEIEYLADNVTEHLVKSGFLGAIKEEGK